MMNNICSCIEDLLTARNSLCENMCFNWALKGTINNKKNGNANDAFVDLTIHNTTKHINWMNVNRCIFAVFT